MHVWGFYKEIISQPKSLKYNTSSHRTTGKLTLWRIVSKILSHAATVRFSRVSGARSSRLSTTRCQHATAWGACPRDAHKSAILVTVSHHLVESLLRREKKREEKRIQKWKIISWERKRQIYRHRFKHGCAALLSFKVFSETHPENSSFNFFFQWNLQ